MFFELGRSDDLTTGLFSPMSQQAGEELVDIKAHIC